MKTFLLVVIGLVVGIGWVMCEYLAVSPAMYERATVVCKDHGGVFLVVPIEEEKVICSSGLTFTNFVEK